MNSTVSYNTPHAPFGGFSAFTCGYAASWEGEDAPHSGGFSPSTRFPANQNLFIGWRVGDGEWNLLPFFRRAVSRAHEFTGENGVTSHGDQTERPQTFRAITKEELKRTLGFASDVFSAGPMEVTFFSPFERTPEWTGLTAEKQKLLCAPVVPVWCTIDNSSGSEPIEFMFGFGDRERGLRVLGDTHPELAGFASGLSYGFATRPQDGLRLRSGMDLFFTSRKDHRHVHLLGSEAAVILAVPAGGKSSLPIVLGFYQQGTITTGIETSFYYTKFFSRLEEVLEFGLSSHDELCALARTRDQELDETSLTADQKWILAHSMHCYLASTELLLSQGRLCWAVNEGEYRMLNTFDLLADHLFLEVDWWPWAVRDTLDLFASRYSYRDTIHSPDGRRADGGISFTHDMGVDNQFSPVGRSSYELPNLRDCFSHMTCEQLTNWICCAVTYAERTGDRAWLASKDGLLRECAESLRRRDDPDPARRTGILRWDSDRCGLSGAEITTYDSLDVSLGQARNNLYLAVKTLAAWLLLSRAFERLGDATAGADCFGMAKRTAGSVRSFQEKDSGMFPAVFEGDNRSRIIPAIEGLIFPLFLGMQSELAQIERSSGLVSALGDHTRKVLTPGICLDAITGGWKLSSTSLNTWLSKIFLCQFVAQTLCPDLFQNDGKMRADEVHISWLLSPVTRPLGYCDQIRSTDGFPFGSKYYPRGITAWLWVGPRATR